MRAFHIGVAALAAALVAGCGGGSDTREDELTAKVEELETELEKRLTPEQVTEQVTDARNEGREEGRREGAREGNRLAEEAIEDKEEAEDELEEAQQALAQEKRQGNLRQRAPALIAAIKADFSSEEEITGVTVEYMRGGTRKVEPDDFYNRGSAPPSISGWSGGSFSRDVGDFNDTLYLYTNLGSPNTRPFWKVHGAEPLEMTAALEGIARGSSAQPNPDTSPGEDGTAGHQFSMLTISGSLGGTSGKFVCATGCSGTVNDDDDGIDDDVTFKNGRPDFSTESSWVFTPSSYKAAHQRDQDETYLYFGIWERSPKEASGTPDLRWIRGGGAETGTALANYGQLTGKATFTGGAIGQYVINKTSVGGIVEAGIFAADATLRADFTNNELDGEINNFRDRANPSSSLKGNIYLGGPDIADPDTGATLGAAGTTDGMAFGTVSGVRVTGDWQSRLYGQDNGTPVPADTECPNGCGADVAGVSGWFNADSGNDNIVAIGGAFAAD